MEMNEEYKTPVGEPSLLSMLALLTGLSLFVGAVVALVFTVSKIL